MKINLSKPLQFGLLISLVTASITSISLLMSKIDTTTAPPPSNPQKYINIIAAYTSGEISKNTPITVRFVDEQTTIEEIGKEFSSPLSITPKTKGTCKWIDTRTIQFTPHSLFENGTQYTATINLKKVNKEIPDSLARFTFSFYTPPPSFTIHFDGVSLVDNNSIKWYKVTGAVNLADFEEEEKIKKLLTVNTQNKHAIKWTYDSLSLSHGFVIDSIERLEEVYDLTIRWNGKAINSTYEGERTFSLNALGDFSHLGVYTFNAPEQSVVIEFSDPLKRNQNLDGLIQLGKHKFDYIIDGNKLKLFPKKRLIGAVRLKVATGIQNIAGYKTKAKINRSITFTQLKPEVRLLDKKTIIPQNGTLIPFVFEAVSLKAVDIRIIKIYEKNIPQFLQVNQLNQHQELKRVGQVILNKKISLETDKNINLGNWNKHVIDLAKIIETEPGAIYEVAIGFRHTYSIYGCTSLEGDESSIKLQAEQGMLEVTNWDEPGYNYQLSGSYYGSYRNRDEPCNIAYYRSDRAVRKNVLASSIGLLAKKGENALHFATTNIHTALPLANVKLEVYDYQQHLIAQTTSDEQGFAEILTEKTPFLLIAKKGKERGYLRIDDGSSLSLSRFDVAGIRKQNGLNGFIYGERGVWRPGDSIYLTFILEDKLGSLPKNHPVSFKLTNPQGKIVQEATHTSSLNGFYPFLTRTFSDAITGNYTATISVGGATFSKIVKVETIRPNRLKIELDFPDTELIYDPNGIEVSLKSRWLHGADAPNLKADISLQLQKTTTSFKKYPDYRFDDPSIRFTPEESIVFDGKLDDNGTATPTLLINTKNAPGKLTASFKTKVFEPGGNFSIDRVSVPFHPYPFYVGIQTPSTNRWGMIETDKEHKMTFATVTPNGKPMPNKTIRVELYKLDWSWWWDEYNNNTIYNATHYRDPVSSEVLQTNAQGQVSYSMNIDKDDWGRYFIKAYDENGHSSGKSIYFDWPGWASKRQQDNSSTSMLSFTADKKEYMVGEDITIDIPSSDNSNALIAIESADRVLKTFWAPTTKPSTKVTFKATAAMTPNVYINISLIQAHADAKNDLPLRMYGIVPIKVIDPITQLHPILEMPSVLKPNSTVDLTVREKESKPMTYTIAMVDEGLLDLTRFQTPDAWAHFYQKQALGVKTWDLFDQVISANNLKAKSLLSLGGDGDLAAGKEGQKENRFKPMVRFYGPFHIDANTNKTHQIDIPNYVGSVRTMVVAGYNAAYGSTEKTTPVRQSLMVLSTLPRVLGPSEEISVPVSVFAMDDKVKSATVTLETSNLIEIIGSNTQTVTFNKADEKLVDFKVKVKNQIGQAKISVTAKGSGKTSFHKTDIEIRTPNPNIADIYEKSLSSNTKYTYEFNTIGLEGTNKALLEVSTIPAINLGKRLNYLIRYPYGCIEQTTSSVFPQLHLNKLMKLSTKQKAKIDKNIQAGIRRIYKFQTYDGGLSYWPGGYRHSNEWGSNYGGHFLIEAQKAGYSVDENVLEDWKVYQKKKATDYTVSNYNFTQTYRLYLLALIGAPELGAMNRLRLASDLKVQEKWMLAAAYSTAGQPEIARKLTQNLSLEPDSYKDYYYHSYGSRLRDEAVILDVLSLLKKETQASSLTRAIAKRLNTQKWYSTQTTAYCLLAIAKYADAFNVSETAKVKYRINGTDWKTVTISEPIWQHSYAITGASTQKVEVQNLSGGTVFTKVINEGIPLIGDSTDVNSNLQLFVQYRNLDGQLINPESIAQGTDFVAEVSIKNPTYERYRDLALNQIFPSGWEIHNDRLDNRENDDTSTPTYQDIRDDRIYTFFDINSRTTMHFKVNLNATYKGKFYLPTIHSEAMYDKTINARRHGKWVEVK